ncbi:hypothetical protein Skr01_25360 [Sphaerisporangium krabiense]|uniref:Uncharacterized protein n=1 Tax=Sphaerisporangium krabiense TaxID=763782 RepID=A0A7W9DTG1_9ACTN|nr:DUF5691 domain-containing protein [Sphaerisporangium krabiense]MBB5630593.1 hypothetical protein [Sphaerisporangium krabiense]GII62451.1 hypothetical protein Skr01_25360 [Sphaerisporangium krabiense]
MITIDDWERLVSAALVGTDRRPRPGLLGQAAARTVGARAGQRLQRGEPLPAAPAEEQPPVPRAAADRLARVLGGEQSRLLPEWLEAAAALGYRLPAKLLPPVLDHGARDRSLRPSIGVLAGARGRWLATLNDTWKYVLEEATLRSGVPAHAGTEAPRHRHVPASGAARPSPADAAGGGTGGADAGGGEDVAGHPLWEFGTRGDRLSFLRGLRADDPAKARALLLRGWDKETPEDRAAFVHALSDGLSMADEPFLEAALDDRRREVRAQAADLLTRLPRSRLGLRMTARAALCLRVTGDRLHAEPPAACDAAMERDGIRSRAPAGTGQRSWWLQQVIAHTPLSFWADHFGLPAKRIVALNIGEWAREIRLGWERAAVLQNDAEWARALFAVEPLSDLLAVLPPAERADKAAELVHDQPVDGQLIMMLGGLPAPWGAALAQAVLEKIIATAGHQPWNLEELVRLAGERVDPAMDEMAARLSDEWHVQEVAATLRFRRHMHAELRP